MSETLMNDQYRLLVVDDNRAIHDDIRKVLRVDTANSEIDQMEAELFGTSAASGPASDRMVFEIDSALQGQEGRDLVRAAVGATRPYAVAVVDMRMPPGWDGIETIEHLWQEDPALQVVICTAYSDHSWAEIVDRLKVSDQLLILKKPFDNMELLQIVHALTRKWDLHRDVAERLRDLDSLVEQRTAALAEAHATLKREMAERERMQAELRLAQKLEAVGQLAAGIAHEINTPIQYVGDSVHFLKTAFEDLQTLVAKYQGSFAAVAVPEAILGELKEAEEMADLAYLGEQVPGAFTRTLEGIGRVAEIVRAMKEFAHPDCREKSPADLNQALLNTITVARNEYKYVAEVETDLGELPPVSCNIGELNQVFLNLLVNAAHAIGAAVGESQEKGRIGVSTTRDGDMVEIRLQDSGCGIPAEVRERVFDPFFTTKEVGKGTGQGLAIARSIVVDKHGGDLNFETQEGQGTTFIIRLPADG